MPESITREEALERVLKMAQEAWSDEIKRECLWRAEELASVMDEDIVSGIKAKLQRTIQ